MDCARASFHNRYGDANFYDIYPNFYDFYFYANDVHVDSDNEHHDAHSLDLFPNSNAYRSDNNSYLGFAEHYFEKRLRLRSCALRRRWQPDRGRQVQYRLD